MKKILIASDHAGFNLKEIIKKHLLKKKLKIIDLGPFKLVRVDYPDYAHKLSKKINLNKTFIGILVCGSGIGMEMTANRYKNVRAALCSDQRFAKLSRSHNNANVITLGSRLIKKNIALKCINVFLKTKFKGGRHAKRIKKI
ncbi:MAG TPA: ribose 5-phosphate isomerase B [Pelagibacteraceae bacterium]|nr:ribose 5-phosphate isomerase B [Pelagibacteraceae bacterium]